MTTSTFTVAGMTCGHCVAAVTTELSAIPDVGEVTDALVPGEESTVTVVSDAPLDLDAVRAAVDDAGYDLVG